MKHTVTCLLLFISLLGFGQMSTLELTVTNFEENKGQLIISIFNDPESFPTEGKELKTVVVDKIISNKATVNIELPTGDYAIALLHDRNLDGVCNFNFIGIPTEAYGFSQNVRPIITIPNFEETMFHVDGYQSLEIELIQ